MLSLLMNELLRCWVRSRAADTRKCHESIADMGEIMSRKAGRAISSSIVKGMSVSWQEHHGSDQEVPGGFVASPPAPCCCAIALYHMAT